VVEAVDGVDALKKMTTEKVDMVITDINMPMMDGLKLITVIRGDPRTKTMPIVIVTTEGAEEDRRRGMALGADAYVPKPIQPSDLLKTVTTLLERPR
jgi:two-component system chemotaxis response regulator CheY